MMFLSVWRHKTPKRTWAGKFQMQNRRRIVTHTHAESRGSPEVSVKEEYRKEPTGSRWYGNTPGKRKWRRDRP